MEEGMDARMARELGRYNNWANAQALDVAARLTPDDFTRPVGGSFGSMQATLTHIVWAERLWLARWKTGASSDHLDPREFPSVEALRNRWRPIADDLVAFARALTDERLAETVRYVNLKGETWAYPLWCQVYHAFSHSAYHRGQVTVLFRQLGVRPVTTDFLNFRDAASGPPGSR